MKVFITTLTTRHGTDSWVNATEKGRDAALYDYVVENWAEFSDDEIPTDPDLAIEVYFERASESAFKGEFVDYSTATLGA